MRDITTSTEPAMEVTIYFHEALGCKNAIAIFCSMCQMLDIGLSQTSLGLPCTTRP